MKRNYAFVILLCFAVVAFGQYRDGSQKFIVKANGNTQASKSQLALGDVYYKQNFDDYTEGDMTFIDNDGLTTSSNIEWIGSNWNVVNGVALSASWLIDGNKTSDNWMITPLITLGDEPYLSWDGLAHDATYRDGYEVLISTSGTDISDFNTVLFSVDAEEAEWTTHIVDLAAYADQDVYIAFHHNSTDKYVLAIDNILISHLIGFDVSLDSYHLNKYMKPGASEDISISIESLGVDVLSSVELNYQVNDNPVQTALVNGLKLTYGNRVSLIHDNPVSYSDPGKYDLKIWLSKPNGGSDENESNDTIMDQFYVVSSTFEKTVVLEEFTGTWCGWCPDGLLILQDLLETHDNMIGVCLHAGDVMETEETGELSDAFGSFFPGGSVDRYKLSSDGVILSRNEWGSGVEQRSSMAVPVDVDFTYSYNTGTREIIVDASAWFSQEMSEDFRFNCYVVEDNIDSDLEDYDQSNYFSENPTYSDHPYYSEPASISDFVHKHVVREMLGGAWGAEGSVPETVVAGETYTHQFTHILSEDFNERHVSLVVVVQEYNEEYTNREIHNAKEQKLMQPSIALFMEDGTPIYDGETIEVDGLATDIEFGVKLLVQNVASTATTIGVEKANIEDVAGTTNTFCWAVTCYSDDILVSSSNSVMGPDSINTEFRADIAPNDNDGVHKMRYTFFNADDAKDYFTVYILFNIAEGTGIEQRNTDDIRIYPNPVRENGVLSIDNLASDAKRQSVKIFDSTSRLLMDQIIDPASGKLEIQLSQYQISPGTYYILVNSDLGLVAQPIVVVK